MKRRYSVQFVLLVISILIPAALFAQDTRFNGIWVAPVTKGTGPGFLVFTFNATGDTLTGALSDKGGPADRLTNAKIENGHLSFSLNNGEMSYSGTLKDARHLDLIEVIRFTDHKLVRKPGTQGPANSPEGEWVEEGRPGAENTKPIFRLHVEGEKISGEVLDHAIHDGVVGEAVTLPLTEGSVHGNEVSFGYLSRTRDPMHYTGALVGERLVLNTEATHHLRAVRLADGEMAPAPAVASLAGLWVSPITKGTGPGFKAYTFTVNGDRFTGGLSDKGGPANRFNDGKIENGKFSFSLPKEQLQGGLLEESFTGTFKDSRHLDLVSDLRISGYKIIRKAGTQGRPNSLEGEWQLDSNNPDLVTFVFHLHEGDLIGEVLEHEVFDGVIGPLVSNPLTGKLHGNEFSFSYINRRHNPSRWTGTIVGDHLIMNSEVTSHERAVRLADVPGEPVAASSAPSAASGSHAGTGKMDRYRTLARMAMDAVKKNDLAAASKLCDTLENEWDDNQRKLHSDSPDIWEQIDHAMDQFIHPIMASGRAAPNVAELDAAYHEYLSKLKLAD